MIAELYGKPQQQGAEVLSDGGAKANVRMTRLGQLLTVDWKYNLIMGGLAWSGHIGTLTAGADVGLIVGGGAGTTPDSDKPEMILGVDAGYFLIPMECKVTCDVDIDADADFGSIVLFADRTKAPPTSVSGTPGIITPNNQLDGGGAFPGRWFGGITTDLDDPVMDELLDYEYVAGATDATGGLGLAAKLKMDYQPQFPVLLKGPCSLVVSFGGTAAVNGMIRMVVAAVPVSWFES